MTDRTPNYLAGRKFAEQESASLAGLCPGYAAPSLPDEIEPSDPEFNAGYDDYFEERPNPTRRPK